MATLPRVLRTLRTRLAPALLFATGVSLVTAGLLSYTVPVQALPPGQSAEPSIDPGNPSPSALITFPPLASPSSQPSTPAGSPSAAPSDRVATRVVIPALDIDLPIIKGPPDYPPCNVAMYLKELHQPGEKGATYIFAHAREGMFLPLLTQSQINNGAALKSMLVEVYTSDDQLFLYQIYAVRRHATSIAGAYATKSETLWLQTSEGFHIPQKLQVVAKPLSVSPAAHADAHPKPHPINCE